MPQDVALTLYPEKAAGGFTRVDGTVQFYGRVNALIGPESVVVDLGAGRGQAHHDDACGFRRNLRLFKGKCRRVIGLDVDKAVLENPSVDEALLIGVDGRFPLGDATVDVIVSDATFEHVDDPARFCAEIERVLKPGGWLCARTPNRWGYIGMGANLIPNKAHVRLLRHLQPGRKAADVFPTRYRMNTRSTLRRCFPKERWTLVAYTWNAEPAYFGRSALLWRLARAMFWLTPEPFGSIFMIFAQKK